MNFLEPSFGDNSPKEKDIKRKKRIVDDATWKRRKTKRKVRDSVKELRRQAQDAAR
jgi:hypothetical protein